MFRTRERSTGATLIALGLTTFVLACGDKVITNTNVVIPLNVFTQTNLVSDVSGLGAATIDPALVNPWGITFGSTGFLWVSNNGTGTSTVYDQNGAKQSLSVTIPAAGNPIVNPLDAASSAAPTGVAVNTTTDYPIGASGAATFIFASEDGAIAAWNASQGTTAVIMADHSADTSVYKGIALGVEGTSNRAFATDFHHGHVVEFDSAFNVVRTFTDSTAPAGYAPFGIANIGGQLYVSFAKQQGPNNVDDSAAVGNGIVDVFSTSGVLLRRFAANGLLNSPWGMVQAPAGFGPFGGAILIGNFGDGHIGAYDAGTGAFIDFLRDAAGNPITNSGLWGLSFGPAGNASALYFAAGLASEQHGLVGTITHP